jgi:glycosyltransferase involved in cell wall biosynthesis
LYRAPSGEPRISIVIVSDSRADEIERCLADLAAQHTTVTFEVLLLLQAYPRDATDRLVKTFSHAFPLHVFHATQSLGVHVARNAALARTSADIIAFLDDDVRVPTDWVESLAPYYEDSSVGGVGGFVRHPGSQRVITRVLRPVLGLSSRRYRIDWGAFTRSRGLRIRHATRRRTGSRDATCHFAEWRSSRLAASMRGMDATATMTSTSVSACVRRGGVSSPRVGSPSITTRAPSTALRFPISSVRRRCVVCDSSGAQSATGLRGALDISRDSPTI